ncbi:hypothetical protein IWX90DRAFT_513627 [Phyllosticta citrichinensis]|uniref:Uncharacterized protein n=1 Tax=Phyllosticta citrichinensis TaxID=1130410 RepID=A0ABR1XT04_9PEZI
MPSKIGSVFALALVPFSLAYGPHFPSIRADNTTAAGANPQAAGAGAAPQAAGQAPGDACKIATALFNGIGSNILVQQNEQLSTTAIQSFLKSNDVGDQNLFSSLKSNLITVVGSGITIRQTNQGIAGQSNPAASGLQTVANAQMQEMSLAQSLTGDPQKDLPVIDQLLTAFSGGISQNQQNQQAALSACQNSAGQGNAQAQQPQAGQQPAAQPAAQPAQAEQQPPAAGQPQAQAQEGQNGQQAGQQAADAQAARKKFRQRW